MEALHQARPTKEEFSYNATYEDIMPVKDLADKFGILVMGICHLSKSWRSYESPLDAYHGSVALSGAADNLLALVSKAEGKGFKKGKLWVEGRNIPDAQMALELTEADLTWRWLGDAAEYDLTTGQNGIIQAISELGEASPKEISAFLARPLTNVGEMLFRMLKQGRLERVGYGRYRLPKTPNSPNHTRSSNSPKTSQEGVDISKTPNTPNISQDEVLESLRTFGSIRETPLNEFSYIYPLSPEQEKWYEPKVVKDLLITQEYSWRENAAIQDEIRKERERGK